MSVSKLNDLTRRAFLRRASAISALGVGAPLALNLAGFGEASAFEATDYKAIVCVFLYGGNDHNSTIIPYDIPNYDLYSAIRGGGANRSQGGVALARDDLTATRLSPLSPQILTDNLQYALAPQLTGLKALFDQGKLGMQMNIGPLLVPMTRQQFESGDNTNFPTPPKLFSHNDQQSYWQSLGVEGSSVGWGGRLGDLALASNGNSLLTCISATGNAVFVSGNQALQYQIGPDGATPIYATEGLFGSSQAAQAIRQIMTKPSSHILENEYARVTKRALDTETSVNAALAQISLNTPFGNSYIDDQLKIVARIIGARASLGAKRQVFFVSMGGFDLHDNLINNQPGLMALLNNAMSSFYQSTLEMGIADKVVSFTASDFGRTLAYNGDGSDHGWGAHHFIMGGGVRGGQFYGTAPHTSVISNDQVGEGRLLPTTSIDQFVGTLAKWFGANTGEISNLLPNLGRFATPDLGFML